MDKFKKVACYEGHLPSGMKPQVAIILVSFIGHRRASNSNKTTLGGL